MRADTISLRPPPWGAAIALARALPESSGQVVLVGAPAEEVGGGKVDLVRSGVFESVDVAMMAHPSCRTYVGGTNRAFADIQIEFAGKASHAAEAAGDGVNALEAVLLTFSSVNSLRQHMRSDGHLHGIITAGGVRPNIVPERAVAQFYVRAADSAYVEQLVGQLRRCAEGGGVGYRSYTQCAADWKPLSKPCVRMGRWQPSSESIFRRWGRPWIRYPPTARGRLTWAMSLRLSRRSTRTSISAG